MPAASTLEPMEILVNGKAHQVPEGCTAAELLNTLQLGGIRVAMEVNLDIVPRSRYSEHHLEPGDRVEIVRAIGGG